MCFFLSFFFSFFRSFFLSFRFLFLSSLSRSISKKAMNGFPRGNALAKMAFLRARAGSKSGQWDDLSHWPEGAFRIGLGIQIHQTGSPASNHNHTSNFFKAFAFVAILLSCGYNTTNQRVRKICWLLAWPNWQLARKPQILHTRRREQKNFKSEKRTGWCSHRC